MESGGVEIEVWSRKFGLEFLWLLLGHAKTTGHAYGPATPDNNEYGVSAARGILNYKPDSDGEHSLHEESAAVCKKSNAKGAAAATPTLGPRAIAGG